tara:strand:- start:1630 stop:2886 length:1257 start_codon:yes stop_codon:yes gene_type:complete
MSTVRPIDLLFQDEVRRFGSRANEGGMYPRATYGVIEPLTQSKPISITIDKGNVTGMPSGQTSANNALMDQSMTSGLLGNQLFDPKTFGLLGASAELLKQGGYSTTPRTFGEGLGQAMITGLQNFSALQQAQNKANQPIAVPKGGTLIDPKTKRVLFDGRTNVGGFSGSGLNVSSYNTILDVNNRIASGEKFSDLPVNLQNKYKLAYSNVTRPTRIPIPDGQGGTVFVEKPPINIEGFYNPFPNQGGTDSNILGKKPSALELKIKENRPKLFRMLSNLNKYKILLKNSDFGTQASGMIGFPSVQATRLSTLAEALRLNIKDLEGLGALVGGDFQILANRLTSPNTSAGLRMGKDGLLVQLENLEEQLLDTLKDGGVKETGAFSDPILAMDEKTWKNGRFGLYYKLPNGNIVLKERKLN